MDNNEATTTLWNLITDAWAEDAQRMINAAHAEENAYAIRSNPNRATKPGHCAQCCVDTNVSHDPELGCLFKPQPYTAAETAMRELNAQRRNTIQQLSDHQRVEVLMTLMISGNAADVQRAIDSNPNR